MRSDASLLLVDKNAVPDLTGLALADQAVAQLIRRRAMDHGIGTSVPWPW